MVSTRPESSRKSSSGLTFSLAELAAFEMGLSEDMMRVGPFGRGDGIIYLGTGGGPFMR